MPSIPCHRIATYARRGGLIAAGCLATSCKLGDFTATLNQLQGDPYPLDERSRALLIDGGKVSCPDVALLDYGGTSLKFVPPLRITPPFVERLRHFEELVLEIAERNYGRRPRSVHHAGGYVCRPVEHRAKRYSEHALGNAVDVIGFGFDRIAAVPLATSKASAEPVVAKQFRGSFQVTVAAHWRVTSSDSVHSKFLHELIDEVVEQGVFRTVLGPGAPGHDTHFHFDMAPWNHVNIQ